MNASQIQRFPTSFMPHLGQVPAASFTTSGCIGQAYCSYRARIAIGVEKSLACGNDSKPVLPVMEAQGRPLQPLDDVNCGVRLAASRIAPDPFPAMPLRRQLAEAAIPLAAVLAKR